MTSQFQVAEAVNALTGLESTKSHCISVRMAYMLWTVLRLH